MDRNALLKYVNENKGADIPALQTAFNLSYAEAQEYINSLVEEGKLVYSEGVRYALKKESRKSPFDEFNRRRRSADGKDGESDFSFLFRKDEDSLKDQVPDSLSDDLKRKALKIAVDLGKISVSDLVLRLTITYFKANSLICWMQGMKYISGYKSGNGGKRDVLISAEDFEVLYGEDEEAEENDSVPLDSVIEEMDDAEITECEKQIIDVQFKNVYNKATKKSGKTPPEHPSWDDETEFDGAVKERMQKLVKSDINMGWQRAVKKAENYLEAVKDTCDKKMTEVYERLLFEIKGTGNYMYAQLKKQFFG